MSPSQMFFQPITNLVWNRCRSAQSNSRGQVTFSARKIPSTLLEGGVGGFDVVVSGIHIFFEIGKGHY